MSNNNSSQGLFQEFKAICVPLMGSSKLTNSNLAAVSRLLDDLNALLLRVDSADLTNSIISYVFFPISTILQRNSSAELPDRILEQVLSAMCSLMETWWWTCETKIWEQLFMLCGSIVGGLHGPGKAKARAEETKEVAARCILAILRPRMPDDAQRLGFNKDDITSRQFELELLTQSSKFVPVIGQTLEAFLTTSESKHPPLQSLSLEILSLLIETYLPDDLVPGVFPGVMSTMCKVCLGVNTTKGWANGDIVAAALKVIQLAVVRAIGDEPCIDDGAVQRFTSLDDLANIGKAAPTPDTTKDPPYRTRRTASWLRGTATQVHIALNSLSPLVTHPTQSALLALASCSATILRSTSLTLPTSQPLLLSYLLSLSVSDISKVSDAASKHLLALLTDHSEAQLSLYQILVDILTTNLSALPGLVATQSDAKVIHSCGNIEAICRLAHGGGDAVHLNSISKGIGKLLGPTGGIERWGWSLLSVLEFTEPPIVVTHTSSAQLALESNPENQSWVEFPKPVLRNLTSTAGHEAVVRMLRTMGSAGGNGCLFAVEWFSSVGLGTTTTTAVAALWCASAILEGMANITLSQQDLDIGIQQPNKKLDRHVRSLAKSVAELWDKVEFELTPTSQASATNDAAPTIRHQKGLVPLHETLKIIHPTAPKTKATLNQPLLHRAICLNLISISAGVLQTRFESLFIHTLYPVLHALVSPFSFLSSTALASLHYISAMTSHASPANLLLSNFDYILDSVSRRLTRRWLDIDATKVLALMVRLVGADIVERASDVVEECFDRLDEYHGYTIIVDGLMEVLGEVLRVIEKEAPLESESDPSKTETGPPLRKSNLDDLYHFLDHRFDEPEEDMTDYGPAPREAWGKKDKEGEGENGESSQNPAKQPTDAEPQPTPIQVLTKQIISRSAYFLTHDSPTIRSKVLNLLTLSTPVLPSSALMPAVHSIWPFVLNRLRDPQTFVVSAASALVEALSTHVGPFMFRRVWDDVWPIFRTMLKDLQSAESTNALAKKAAAGSGASADFAYTHSHRLYRSMIRTMTAAFKGVRPREDHFWEALVLFRRFLSDAVHRELQDAAKELYTAAAGRNPDVVWLVLDCTIHKTSDVMAFLEDPSGRLVHNAAEIIQTLA